MINCLSIKRCHRFIYLLFVTDLLLNSLTLTLSHTKKSGPTKQKKLRTRTKQTPMTTISNQLARDVSLKKGDGPTQNREMLQPGFFGTKSEMRSSRSTSRVYTFANSQPLLTKRDLCELLMRRGTSLSSEGKEGNVIGPGGRTEKLLSLEKRGGNIIYG